MRDLNFWSYKWFQILLQATKQIIIISIIINIKPTTNDFNLPLGIVESTLLSDVPNP